MGHTGDHDRVVMASLKADGSPDQTSDFTFIGDKETSIASTTEQLKQQRVSAADVELRGVGGSEEGDSSPDKAVAKMVKVHESAAKSAASDAKSLVEGRFEDVDKDAASRRSEATENTSERSGGATENTASR
jgi:hypothetical protein